MNPPTPRDDRRTRRLAAATLASAALLAIAGFTALGAVFDYPRVLTEPTGDILAHYREHRVAVSGWFLVLVVSAGLLAPAGILLGRLSGGRLGRWIAGTGIAAAVVQAVGLSRWVLFVPWLSDTATDPSADPGAAADARHTVEVLHRWLGEILGETVGYALTAAFTVLVVAGLSRAGRPRLLILLGYASAILIATGTLGIAGIAAAGLATFAGYVAWCLWLLWVSATLWTQPKPLPVYSGQ